MDTDEHRYAGGRARHSVRAVYAQRQLALSGGRVVGGAHGVTRPTMRLRHLLSVLICVHLWLFGIVTA
jgi:hypothetical protein